MKKNIQDITVDDFKYILSTDRSTDILQNILYQVSKSRSTQILQNVLGYKSRTTNDWKYVKSTLNIAVKQLQNDKDVESNDILHKNLMVYYDHLSQVNRNFSHKISKKCLPSKTAIPYNFIKATSVSPTDIWVFRDELYEYYGKVYIMPTSTYDLSHGVAYEAMVYEYVKKNIIDDPNNSFRHNFIEFVKHCKDLSYRELESLIENFKPNVNNKNIARNMAYTRCGVSNRPSLTETKSAQINNKNKLSCFQNAIKTPQNHTYGIIFTKKPKFDNIMTLWEYMEKTDETLSNKCDVLCKLALCIDNMHTNGINHNDQHWGNVLVAINADKGTETYTTAAGKSYKFPGSKTRPILFDWDRSQIKDHSINKFISPDEFGMYYPTYEPLRDWATFLTYIANFDTNGHDERAFLTMLGVTALVKLPYCEDMLALLREAIDKNNFWMLSTNNILKQIAGVTSVFNVHYFVTMVNNIKHDSDDFMTHMETKLDAL